MEKLQMPIKIKVDQDTVNELFEHHKDIEVADYSPDDDAELIVKKGREYPDAWIEDYLGCSMWSIPKLIARSVFHRPRTVVASCSSASKSHTAARIALAFLYLNYPATVITTAPTFRQVESILWREIRSAFSNSRIVLGGDIQTTGIKIAEDWFAIGLSTDEPERFQGLHNENVLVIGDEASGLSPQVYNAMENPLSSGNAHQLLIGNPTQPVGDFKDAYVSPLYNSFHISAFDTPNFTEFGLTMDDFRENTWRKKIGDEKLPRPYLVSPQWVWERFIEWGEKNMLFQVYVLGNFPEAGVNTLIPITAVEYCMNNPFRNPDDSRGACVASLDIARYGDDETVFMVRKGRKIIHTHVWSHADTVFTAGRVARFIREYKPFVTIIDEVAVGAGVYDQLKANGFNVEPFNASESALDKELFGNIRAELFFQLANEIQANEWELPNDKVLKSQLSDIRYRYNNKGQLLIESKEEARARGVTSPDRADALMMLCKPVYALMNAKPKHKEFL